MKFLSRVIYVPIIIVVFGMAGCKDKDPIPETDRVRELLFTGTWKAKQVTVDAVDRTYQFTGLTLTFTATNYTTTNGKLVWPASGTWKFKNDEAKVLLRDQDVEVTIIEVSSTTLKLSFNWSTTTLGSGRSMSVAGKHEFTLIQ
jgi:hypothetical protein